MNRLPNIAVDSERGARHGTAFGQAVARRIG